MQENKKVEPENVVRASRSLVMILLTVQCDGMLRFSVSNLPLVLVHLIHCY